MNYLALLVAAIIPMILGFVWYGPMLFASQWMKLSGITKKDMEGKKSEMPKMYGTMFVASLVMAYVLSMFVRYTGANTLVAGLMVGFWAWLGFVATTMLTGVLFDGKPLKLYYINAGYQLVSLVLMGALLAAWA